MHNVAIYSVYLALTDTHHPCNGYLYSINYFETTVIIYEITYRTQTKCWVVNIRWVLNEGRTYVMLIWAHHKKSQERRNFGLICLVYVYVCCNAQFLLNVMVLCRNVIYNSLTYIRPSMGFEFHFSCHMYVVHSWLNLRRGSLTRWRSMRHSTRPSKPCKIICVILTVKKILLHNLLKGRTFLIHEIKFDNINRCHIRWINQ